MVKHSMRILITESCNSKCLNCFNSAYRGRGGIDEKTYNRLCEYLSHNNIKRVKIMGGEPTVHPLFERIITISQSYFQSVIIFTNALNNRITNIQPRINDTIVYNFNLISSSFNKDKFLLDQPGRRRLEVQIGSKTNIEYLLSKLSFFSNTPNLKINLTLDCMENIFDCKVELEKKFIAISDYIKNTLKTDYVVDHKIPLCFWSKDVGITDSLCSIDCAGLIDSSLRLRYCNQYEETLCNLVDASGNFIPFDKLLSKLAIGYASKNDIIMRKGCNNCVYFPHKCNGGCFAHKDIKQHE